jgi:pimeloyl-ACP methyl ester carboxylesterase
MIALDDRQVETAWCGPGPDDAPTVVLLHEGLGCVALWRDFPAALAEATGCGVFAYTRSGYGASDPTVLPRPMSYMHDEALTVLPRVLDAAEHFIVEDINIASIAAIKSSYEQGDLRQRLARYHRDVDMAFYGWNGAWLDPRFRNFDITDYIGRIRVPLLALQGEDDPYGTVAQFQVLQRTAHCPLQMQMIPGARHAPHLETRQATLAAVTEFVRQVVA